MKRKLSAIICVLLVVIYSVGLADVSINKKNFPDDMFRLYVQDFDTNGDGKLSDDEISNVTKIYISSANISDLKGIEVFNALKSLSCYNNSIKRLDVSKNIQLQDLDCGQNEIINLDVSKNVNLSGLHCQYNKIAKLDVSKNTSLFQLDCSHNLLKSIDVTRNEFLAELHCGYNNISTLDVSHNTHLIGLSCPYTNIAKVDLCNNRYLIRFTCGGPSLITLDLRNNTSLTDLVIWKTNIKKLDLSKNTKLESLTFFQNKLKELDVSPIKRFNSLVNTIKPETIHTSGNIAAYIEPSSETISYRDWHFGSTYLYADLNTIVITSKDKPLVTSIKLNKSKISIKKGNKYQLSVKEIKPADAKNKKVEWITSDKTVATVSKKGVVTAKGKGTCIITCKSKDKRGVTTTCVVKVK